MTSLPPGRNVVYATVREAIDDAGHTVNHIECRFENGEKYAPIVVDDDREDLAFWIRDALNAAAREAP